MANGDRHQTKTSEKEPMISKIKILPESLMKRIAAGEVVERPASAVKELMENAIDAGATSISLWIKDSGMRLIQVTDDGEGMAEEDALLCCERHATSKISRVEDLDGIRTLGFRGEALASIGSVSRMTIMTRTAETEEGTQVCIEEGKIREVQKVATPRGTTVAVKDLFSFVPARRKFLKSPTTELRHIASVFRRMALSHHDIDFSLVVEDEKTMDLRRSTREHRLRDLLGEDVQSRMIPIRKELAGISVEGFVSPPGEGKKNRENQFFFLNGRYIINRSLMHAVLSSYGPRLGRHEYPVFLLFLETDPRQVDVNVHPTKIEVRFSDERYVYEVVKKTIQEALRRPAAVPDLQLISRRGKMKGPAFQRYPASEDYGQLTLEVQRPAIGERRVEYGMASGEKPSLWQIHNRYILSQIKSGLTIIDQHAAHERILYERALKSILDNAGLSQQLLFPQTVQLSHEDYLILTEILPTLQKIGFGLKEFGKNTVVIEAVPVEVKTGEERDLLSGILDTFKEMRRETMDAYDAVARSFACKSAVKSGASLSLQEMASLIDQLFATQEPFFCPHGRPTVVNLSLEEIDKRFGR